MPTWRMPASPMWCLRIGACATIYARCLLALRRRLMQSMRASQADSHFRLRPRDIENLSVRNQQGDMIPLGTIMSIEPVVGVPLISLYNLYPSSSIIGLPAAGFSSGEAIHLMEADAAHTLPPGMSSEWTAMSYQERLVGNQMFFVFAMALLLVYLVLAGQYESWYA